MNYLYPSDEYVLFPVQLPWKVACKIAVQALIEGITFNDMIERALAERLYPNGETP